MNHNSSTNDVSAGETSSDALQAIRERKRIVYLLALAGGTLIFVLSWLLRRHSDPFIRHLYPAFALSMAAMFPLIWWRVKALKKLEYLMMVAVSIIVMSRLFWHFHLAGPVDEHLLVLAGGHYWAVGVVLIAGFVALDLRGGIWLGVIIIALSAVIATTGIIGQVDSGHPVSPRAILYLIRIHIFMVVILALTSAATSLREKLQRALNHARELSEWARTDVLTGLPNRRGAEQYLRQQAAAVKRYDRSVSLILGDIDRFKRVNDTHGHDAGDRALIQTAQLLEDHARESDVVARWGGEEFLIIAPNTRRAEAASLAQRLRKSIDAHTFETIGHITISMGVAQHRRMDDPAETVKRADTAMYAAKNAGRNRVEVAGDTDDTQGNATSTDVPETVQDQ